MEESRTEKFHTWITMMMVCGISSLLFAVALKILNDEWNPLFLKSGLFFLGSGFLLVLIQALFRSPVSKQEWEEFRS